MVDEFKKKDERRSLALNELGVTEWRSKKNEVIHIQSTVKLVNPDKWGVLRKLGDGIEHYSLVDGSQSGAVDPMIKDNKILIVTETLLDNSSPQRIVRGKNLLLLHSMIEASIAEYDKVCILELESRIGDKGEELVLFLSQLFDDIIPNVILLLGDKISSMFFGSNSKERGLKLMETKSNPELQVITSFHPSLLIEDQSRKSAAWEDWRLLNEFV